MGNTPQPAISRPAAAPPASKLRVLIADDEFHVRSVVGSIVRALGAEVVAEAADGYQAVEESERLAPDVVILDINMPRMRGDEALARILKKRPDTIAIMMTAQDTIDSVQDCLELGARHYILKSNRAEEILRLFSECWPAGPGPLPSTEKPS